MSAVEARIAERLVVEDQREPVEQSPEFTPAAPSVSPLAPSRIRRALAPSVVASLLRLADVLAVLVAAVFAHAFLAAAGRLPPAIVGLETGLAGLGAAILVLVFRVAGLHSPGVVLRPRRNAAAVAVMGIGVLGLFSIAGAASGMLRDLPAAWIGVWAAAAVALLLAARWTFASAVRALAARGHFGRWVVIYGAGEQADRLLAQIAAANDPSTTVVGVFDDRATRRGGAVRDVPVLGDLATLVNWSRECPPDEILIALPWMAEQRIRTVLQRLSTVPADVRVVPEFRWLESMEGSLASAYGLPMLIAYRKPLDGWGKLWKRGFDLSVAGLLLVVLAPLLALIALGIKLTSPGPVLFRQPRFGFNQKLIQIYKFRSMGTSFSDTLGDKLTQRNDPRVTPLGRFLRRTSLDELPQLINVFRGEMSLVGPRPHAIRTTAGGRLCDEVVANYAVRHKVKPGITGWAQVNGWRGTMEDEEHLRRRVEHDVFYLNNWSPVFDFRILVQTLWVLFRRQDVY